MTGCCDDFDTYKHGYQLIRVFSLLMTFSQMRLPCTHYTANAFSHAFALAVIMMMVL